VAIPSKGVPAFKLSDGPNGARGEDFKSGPTAACFPAATCVGATWDPALAGKIGSALAEETETKGARTILAPTLCIHRHPLGGRNFESFSEDPLLTGKMGIQFVNGVQAHGVSATMKHFVGNEQETDRQTVDENIGERALREIYLKPFEMTVKESSPWAVMTGYNSVNGQHADMNDFTLRQVLRGEWGWDGLVMSDWGGVNSTGASIKAGLDLEMPGPTAWRSPEAVRKAINAGEITDKDVDDRTMAILKYLKKLRYFEDPTIPRERAINRPEHQALIRDVASKGIVLLKNEGNILPLPKSKVKGKTIALLGQAKTSFAHGGGSASLNAHYKVTPWDALSEAWGDDVKLLYARGAHTFRTLPAMFDGVTGLDGTPGFTYKLVEPGNPTPIKIKQGFTGDVNPVNDFSTAHCHVSLEGTLTVPESGDYYMTLSGTGPCALLIDGKVIHEQLDNTADSMAFLFGSEACEEVKVYLEDGRPYSVDVEAEPPVKHEGVNLGCLGGNTGVRVGFMSGRLHDQDLLGEAIDAAKEADIAIVFTGNEPIWESEGQDQVSFHLPKDGSQDRLVTAVSEINRNTIVVNSTGVAVAMPWLNKIQSLVHTWFAGQEAGNSIADVITGRQNPEGHLTCTFPRKIEDCPAYGNFPGEVVNGPGTTNRLVTYNEGVFVGYRHFDRVSADKVNFPFGFGLSYTNFTFSDLKVREAGDDYAIGVSVTNTGKVAGGVAVQVYFGAVEQNYENPLKVLVAFSKVRLNPGETATAVLPVKSRDLAFYDEVQGQWVVKEGRYNFMVGKNAQEVVLKKQVRVSQRTWRP
jgi:beta-glucosidase